MTKDINDDNSAKNNGSSDETPRSNTNQAGNQSGGNGQSKNRGSLKLLFEGSIRDIYNAEKQLLVALPVFADACFDEDLKDAFIEHIEHTHRHAHRLEKICRRLHINRHEKHCKIIESILKDIYNAIDNEESGALLDVQLIIAAQKIEHYEIGAYTAICGLAKGMRLPKIVDILKRSLAEEDATHKFLLEAAVDVNTNAGNLLPGNTKTS